MSSESPASPAPASGLRVGYVQGVTLAKWRRIWSERFPLTPLEVSEVPPAEQRARLDSGEVDLCFVRLPLDTEGLHAIRLYDEVPVVVAPKDHPLAAFDEVTLADLEAEVVVPDDLPDAFDRVAWGAGVLRVPHSVARSHSRRDLVYRPVTDAAPTTVALVWLVDNSNGLIEEFIGIVRGRTVNSSRTAAARAGATGAPAPAPGNRKPAANRDGKAPHTRGRSGRGQRRRRS